MCGCACGCGPKNWDADACAAHYENVCDVRAGADENPRTLKVCFFGILIGDYFRRKEKVPLETSLP